MKAFCTSLKSASISFPYSFVNGEEDFCFSMERICLDGTARVFSCHSTRESI